jgi:hypothetical protein
MLDRSFAALRDWLLLDLAIPTWLEVLDKLAPLPEMLVGRAIPVRKPSVCTRRLPRSTSTIQGRAGVALTQLGSGDNHIHMPAAATGAHETLAPFGDGRLGAVALGHRAGVGLDLPAGVSTPYAQPHIAAAASPRVIVGA